MAKKRPRSAAAEPEIKRLFMGLLKQTLPTAPDPPEQIAAQDRARLKREL